MTNPNLEKQAAEVKAPAVVGPWGDLCRCADCLAGKNGPTTVRGA